MTGVMAPGLSAFAGAKDLVLCDIWGVLHDGVTAHPGAHEALARFRRGGGLVLLVSNAPRPSSSVRRGLDRLGVPNDAYDAIVTSGDVARGLIAAEGSPVFHLGPERDLPLFKGLDAPLAPPAEAARIVCTGLFDDETEQPDDYEPMLGPLAARGLPMICANPDLVVERGDRLIPCAGALALVYERLGGLVAYSGKPHPPIYEAAMAQAGALGAGPVAAARVLAVGDALRTDLDGAARLGVDALFIACGIHAAEIGAEGGGAPDEALLAALLAGAGLRPVATLPRLVW